jgi:hypothetical protein
MGISSIGGGAYDVLRQLQAGAQARAGQVQSKAAEPLLLGQSKPSGVDDPVSISAAGKQRSSAFEELKSASRIIRNEGGQEVQSTRDLLEAQAPGGKSVQGVAATAIQQSRQAAAGGFRALA